ncbi:hypothetical protein J8F10_35115 [Gemmata sp. G18]|uniref:PEP-CTERM sorting domain-containing protein n=1 Tax=Gemmata palustris TaxID=2822762 RepID=A0ABS5C3D2_9BACT|nr:hypothetical protein [Gemmata palustris]MBP3960486.1 hypothetical protein [Gemmata palustris]
MSRLKFLMVATVAAAAALVAPAKSEAALTVTIKDGANTTILTDGDNDGLITTPTAATNSTTGGVVVGGYRIGLTSSFTPGAISSELTTNTTLRVFRTGGAISGPLTITVLEDNLTTPVAPASGLLNLLNALTLLQVTGTGSNVSVVTIASNIPAGAGDPTSTSAVTLSNPNSGGDSHTTFKQTTNPYSLSQVFTVTLGSGGSANFSGTGSVNAAPAPAGLVMLATVLPFAGMLRRRLRKSEVATVA